MVVAVALARASTILVNASLSLEAAERLDPQNIDVQLKLGEITFYKVTSLSFGIGSSELLWPLHDTLFSLSDELLVHVM